MTGTRVTSVSLALAARAMAAAAVLLCFGLAAAAQETKPAAPPPAPASQPGMLDSVGRWFRDSYQQMGNQVERARQSLGRIGESAGGAARDAGEAAQEAADAARDAADVMAKLPNARIVEGRARCTVAGNGAPDCRNAAESVCKGKGFAAGTSLEIQSAQKCPARVWLSGRSPDPGECGMESFVTRAVCQ